MNRIQLSGRLTRDPEVRYTQTGRPVASFSLAVNRYIPGNTGEQKADFINCVAWGVLAENIGNSYQKGMMVWADGRIQTRSYDGNDGQKKYITEVVVSNSGQSLQTWEAKENGSTPAPAPRSNQGQSQGGGISSFGSEVLPDEDIPF